MSRRMNWDRVRLADREAHAPLQTEKQYLRAHKPLTRKQREFIRNLREQLGDETKTYPKTCAEGRALIDHLLNQRRVVERKNAALDSELDERVGYAA